MTDTQTHCKPLDEIPDGTVVLIEDASGDVMPAFKDRDGYQAWRSQVGDLPPLAFRGQRIVAVLHRDDECPAVAERDRARDLAARLEAELARVTETLEGFAEWVG